MDINVDLFSPVIINVDNQKLNRDNFISVKFDDISKSSSITLDLSDNNFKTLTSSLMPKNDLNTILLVVNAAIDQLNSMGYNLYDDENAEFYMSGVHYDTKTDKLYFQCANDE